MCATTAKTPANADFAAYRYYTLEIEKNVTVYTEPTVFKSENLRLEGGFFVREDGSKNRFPYVPFSNDCSFRRDPLYCKSIIKSIIETRI